MDVLITCVRAAYGALALYALFVLVTRWRVYKVMTQDRRWLFLALAMELTTSVASAAIKLAADAPADVSIFGSLLTQLGLAAYLHYSVPRSYRRWLPGRDRSHG